MFTNMSSEETFAFQSDINQLLSIIINAFYSNKDVFLRELISNASDALDKIRYLSLTDKNVLDINEDLSITIVADKANNTLCITDSGIGMSRQDLIDNLGVIAKSGTREFIEKLTQSDSSMSLIGQFGCGAYSAFLVADKVTFTSKKNGDDQWIWESSAGGTFSIKKDATTLGRGTSVTLHLKDDSKEYLEESKITEIVKKHSEFISYPIKLLVECEVKEETVDENDEEGTVEEVQDEENVPLPKMVKRQEWKMLNEQKPLWLRKPDEVTPEEYNTFYKGFSGDWEEHQAVKHFSVEGQLEFHAMLFLPSHAPFEMMDMKNKPRNMKLYVRRVFIMDDCEHLMPEYLSFIKGVVDSDDLPLNVSREMLQQNRILKVIKKNLVKKCLEMFAEMAESNKEDYKKFWDNFSKNIKWGLHEDSANKPKLLELLRYNSSKSTDELTSLKDYVSRMQENQKHIYYITGENQKTIENSPFLEKLKERDFEVLYMTEVIDEYVMQGLREYEGKTFKCATKDNLEFDDSDEEKKRQEAIQAKNEDLCNTIKEMLGNKVAKVKVSHRMVKTPCVLVTDEYGHSANMERIMKSQALGNTQMYNQMRTTKILEINVEHPILTAVKSSIGDESKNKQTRDLINLLYDAATIASGFTLDEPTVFTNKIYNMITMGLSLDDEDEDESEEEHETVVVNGSMETLD